MSRGRVPWLLVAAVLGASALSFGRILGVAQWKVPVEPSRMPCTIRPGTAVDFFLDVPHPGFAGIGFEHLPSRRLPPIFVEVRRVTDDSLLAQAHMRAHAGELLARFRPVSLPPQATVKVRLVVGAGPEPLMLTCRPSPQAGAKERPVLFTSHSLGTGPISSLSAWLGKRVAPLLPPGALAWVVVVSLCAVLAAAWASWVGARGAGSSPRLD